MQNIEEIYKKYFETVYKYLFCLTHNIDLSEELTQETFYRAVKQINKFNGTCKLSVWLCQIAKNLWYDECRKNKKMSNLPYSQLLEKQLTYCMDEDVLLKEEKKTLYQRIKSLDTLTQEVIYLRISNEFSFKEIATILNKTENWARVTFYRGKQKLKEVNSNEE